MENNHKPLSFGLASLWTILIASVLYGLAITTRNLSSVPGVSGLIAAVGALFTALIIEKKFSHSLWKNAFSEIGFKTGHKNQLFPLLVGVSVIIVSYFSIALFLNHSFETESMVLFLLLKLLIAQGFIEEAVFRGLIFRHLRKGRSFWLAATLSGSLFALIHLVNLVKGTTPEILIAVGTSIAFGFLMTFPLAALFEIGGGSVLAGAVFHLAVDSINCFKDIGVSDVFMNTYLAFLLLSCIGIMWASKKYLKVSWAT